ncbi:MAG TPA: LacI family DNA-binding transcriptional regulator [Bryobacteraceae bacterium]|nr:LacI family DNA-binding transcriptional regulator [Bryobacteraceae bacterium]
MKVTKPTLNAVARRANVSASTVSRLLRGTMRVTPEIEERIRRAAEELGFSLNRENGTRIITFLFSNRDVLHYFHSLVLASAEVYLARRDYNLLYLSLRYSQTTPWREVHLPKLLQRRDLVSGFIVAGTNTQNLFDLLAHRKVPFVVFGNNVAGPWKQDKIDSVWSDDVQGGMDVTRCLLTLGHRDIWYVGNTRLTWHAHIYEGYCRAMTDAGCEPRLSEFDSEDEHELGYLTTKSILNRGLPVTALFAGGDVVARGVYQALAEAGLRVPADVSVAGYNDIEAENMRPPLTSVRVFSEQIGKALAELLLNRVSQPDLPPQRRTIPTQVILRESCAPPLAGTAGPPARQVLASQP